MSQEYIPFAGRFSDAIGRGSDSVVVGLREDRTVVVKWNHDPKNRPSSPDYAMALARYLHRKNKMLQEFLGDFIPDTTFVVGNKLDGDRLKYKAFTLQQRVPQHRICELNPDLLHHPVLLSNLNLLASKLYRLMGIIDEANEIFPDAQLDAKLDLGGISDIAQDGEAIDEESLNLNFTRSPNLLVDPETLHLSCIDFDTGRWDCDNERAFRWVMDRLEDPNIQALAQVPQQTL